MDTYAGIMDCDGPGCLGRKATVYVEKGTVLVPQDRLLCQNCALMAIMTGGVVTRGLPEPPPSIAIMLQPTPTAQAGEETEG